MNNLLKKAQEEVLAEHMAAMQAIEQRREREFIRLEARVKKYLGDEFTPTRACLTLPWRGQQEEFDLVEVDDFLFTFAPWDDKELVVWGFEGKKEAWVKYTGFHQLIEIAKQKGGVNELQAV